MMIYSRAQAIDTLTGSRIDDNPHYSNAQMQRDLQNEIGTRPIAIVLDNEQFKRLQLKGVRRRLPPTVELSEILTPGA